MANTVPIAKTYKEIRISSMVHWSRVEGEDGSETYTSADPAAGMTVILPNGDEQVHDNCPIGKKFKVSGSTVRLSGLA